MNSLTMQFGTDAFATNNALGHSFSGGILQAQIQSAFNTKITNGALSLLFTLPGLNDLAGTNEPALQMGIVNGTPMLPPGNPSTYSGGADLDWWYLARSNEVDGGGTALQQINGSIAASVLNAGPGRFTFGTNQLFDGGQFTMSSVRIRAVTGASSAPLRSTNSFPPGHLASENVGPALTSFATMSGGQLRGNVSAESLANTPIPQLMVVGDQGYTAAHSLLDVIIGGWSQLGGLIRQVTPTQPDKADPDAPVVGAGPPYRFTADISRKVVGCRDRNSTPVPLADGLKAAAYSAYFTFTSDRIMVLKLPSPPPTLSNPARLAGGAFHFSFASSPDAPFTVLATTNVGLPVAGWMVLGSPTQSAAGFYEFTDPAPATGLGRFYGVRSP